MKGTRSTSLLRDFTWLLLGLGGGPWLVAQTLAQPLAKTVVPVTATAVRVSTNVPPAKSPVDFFRELLAMDADEREERLGGREPTDRKAILAKLQEYESLTPEERELR